MKKHRKLTDFTKKPIDKPAAGVEERREEKPSGDSLEQILREVEEIFSRRHRTGGREEITGRLVEKNHRAEEIKTLVISDDKLLAVAREAFARSEITSIECDKQGVCRDGKRLGEVFEDKGLKWQRSYLNTTRLPLYLNFIAEEASIRGRVGKAFIVETSRGNKAIIPDDFICEAVTRLGILLKIDKCTNYKPSPWAEKSRRRKK